MRAPIAIWNPARDVWETGLTDLFSEHSDAFLATWPTSGVMTSDGTAYALPTSELRTADSASSFLLPTPDVPTGGEKIPPGARKVGSTWLREDGTKVQVHLSSVAETMLLPTPTVSDGNGAGAHGTGGQDLRTTVSLLPTPTSRDGKGANQRGDATCLHGALLPTPRATDGTNGGPNQRGSSGDLMLPSAVHQLLPTPKANDWKASGNASPAVVNHVSAGFGTLPEALAVEAPHLSE